MSILLNSVCDDSEELQDRSCLALIVDVVFDGVRVEMECTQNGCEIAERVRKCVLCNGNCKIQNWEMVGSRGEYCRGVRGIEGDSENGV